MPFLRYTVIGAFATLTHYLLLLALVEGHWLSPAPATVAGALAGALIAYMGNRRFTFASAASLRHSLPRFFLVALVGAALNGLLVWVGTAELSLHYLLAQVLATGIVLGLTYECNRRWSFGLQRTAV